ncbi:unnamed protein product [Polarella glacialis]|uniref:Uncharacterized protein n=1 Tax=Polarella glacialis TaxID=89957 RepID=A0A813JPX0_POLGL|nr:unnamed protein product [Polarella glacialis]
MLTTFRLSSKITNNQRSKDTNNHDFLADPLRQFNNCLLVLVNSNGLIQKINETQNSSVQHDSNPRTNKTFQKVDTSKTKFSSGKSQRAKSNNFVGRRAVHAAYAISGAAPGCATEASVNLLRGMVLKLASVLYCCLSRSGAKSSGTRPPSTIEHFST